LYFLFSKRQSVSCRIDGSPAARSRNLQFDRSVAVLSGGNVDSDLFHRLVAGSSGRLMRKHLVV
jgi:hypothetical protein